VNYIGNKTGWHIYDGIMRLIYDLYPGAHWWGCCNI
jgi:hypothetical protein